MRQTYRNVYIEGLAARIPAVSWDTVDLERRLQPLYERMGLEPGWVEAMTGIQSRRVWPDGESYIDGAIHAGRDAMQRAGVSPSDVDVVVNCSVYRARLEPSIACEIQSGLGIGNHCTSFDVSNACLGFLNGMATVANMIELGQIEVGLVVASEDARPILESTLERLGSGSAGLSDFKDNLATLTLGSAACGMVLMSGDRARQGHRLLGGTTRSAAAHHRLCRGDATGMATDAVSLLREGVGLAGEVWKDAHQAFSWMQGPIGTYAMHQVGSAHHDAIVSRFGIPTAQAPRVFPWLGNVGSCGVPVTFAMALEHGRIAKGDVVAMMGIGSGLNCAISGVMW